MDTYYSRFDNDKVTIKAASIESAIEQAKEWAEKIGWIPGDWLSVWYEDDGETKGQLFEV